MKPSGVLAFFVLACAFSWAYWIPMALFGPTVERWDAWPTQVPGLFGRMLAAFVVVAFTEGRAGTRELLRSMARRPRGARAQLATVAPLVFLGFALVVAGVLGDAPAASEFLRYSGTAATTLALFAALVVTGFGEETGWRGYALARLQRRHDPIRASLMVTAGWAVWHVPLFVLLASYADFGPLIAAGWLFGLAAGGLVLTAVFNATGGSVLAVAIWHATYDAGAATDGGDGLDRPADHRLRHLLGDQHRATPSQRSSTPGPAAGRKQTRVKRLGPVVIRPLNDYQVYRRRNQSTVCPTASGWGVDSNGPNACWNFDGSETNGRSNW